MEYPINENIIPDAEDLSALLIFEKVSHSSSIFSATAPHFCQQNSSLLAVAFHIYTTSADASTNFTLFLITLMQKLRQNEFEPLLQRISYAFGPYDVFGLAVFSGNVDEWYGRLKDDGLVESYGGHLKIPFVTWPLFNNEIEGEVPINIELARYISRNIFHSIF